MTVAVNEQVHDALTTVFRDSDDELLTHWLFIAQTIKADGERGV